MSNANGNASQLDEEDLLPEYDFSKGVRGKHRQAYRQGHSVTITHIDRSLEIEIDELEEDNSSIE
jgi:hypothetical protein